MTLAETLIKINKQLSRKIDAALSKEVFQAVRDEEAAVIESEVYDVYPEPSKYRRRRQNGGLADSGNIKIKGGAAKDGVLAVVNTTPPNPGGCQNNGGVTVNKDLPQLIERGYGYRRFFYDFPKMGASYMGPRPFTAKAIENLKKNRAHVTALRDGLRRQGVKVK